MTPRERPVAIALASSASAGIALTIVYAAGGQPQLEGALLGVALGALATALFLWERRVMEPRELAEERADEASTPADVAAIERALASGGEQITRRRVLVRLLFAAGAALAAALAFPIRSLGPRPGRSLFRTGWTPGAAVVRPDGTAVRADEVPVGTVLTVFPHDGVGRADSQALLIRVDQGTLRLRSERLAGAPQGLVCYSKVCTHAGCPVGLYRAQTHELLCPCHQSTFDVLDGARPTFGPATRPLPQLLLEVGPDGVLRSKGDFTGPVGPGFWDIG